MTELSPQAQAARRDLAQIMQELSKYCRVSISATDVLPITLETNDASLEAGINALCAAALRAAAHQVVPEEDVDEADYDCLHAKWAAEGKQEARRDLLAIAAELEGGAGTTSTH